MGLDLRILPAYNVGADFSNDVFSLQREPELFKIIERVSNSSGREVTSEGFLTLLKPFPLNNDDYGKVIKSVRITELKPALKGFTSSHYKNQVFLYFISIAPPKLEVWLFWR